MRIVQIAPLEEPVPPRKYGGIELVVYNLVEALSQLGHEVILLGTGNSQVACEVVPILPRSLRETYTKRTIAAWRSFFSTFYPARILQELQRIQPDIAHNHLSWHLTSFSSYLPCPVFSTIHGPLTNPQERYALSTTPQTPLVSISDAQRAALPDLHWVKTVHNGIDPNRFQSGPPIHERKYFAFLGRTSPEKGLREICELIRTTDYSLKIAAKVDTVDRSYFREQILPLVDGEQIQFLGEVGHEEKVQLLRGAKGLLLWLNWEEPFGLVVIEAMACGTPVITNRRGAMPELVVDRRTGFLVDSLSEMGARLADTQQLSPADCRTHVVHKFSATRMAHAYLELAKNLANS